MRVAVTGSSGFVGSALETMLIARGHDMRKAGRGSAAFNEVLSGCDAIIHLANIAHARGNPALLWEVNVAGSRRVAEAAAAQGVRRMIYLSSIKAQSAEPGDRYGAAKLAAEKAVFEVARLTGLEVIVLRPPLVYGPRVRANFLALMAAIARGWPLPFARIANRRSILYVYNLADAILSCIETPRIAGKSYVVADGEPVSTSALCRALGEALGRPARLFPFPPALLEVFPPLRSLTQSLVADDSAIRKEVGWRPPFSFEQALRATAQWYLAR
jgi:nucleoside-diphosphate-sugar epimerase